MTDRAEHKATGSAEQPHLTRALAEVHQIRQSDNAAATVNRASADRAATNGTSPQNQSLELNDPFKTAKNDQAHAGFPGREKPPAGADTPPTAAGTPSSADAGVHKQPGADKQPGTAKPHGGVEAPAVHEHHATQKPHGGADKPHKHHGSEKPAGGADTPNSANPQKRPGADKPPAGAADTPANSATTPDKPSAASGADQPAPTSHLTDPNKGDSWNIRSNWGARNPVGQTFAPSGAGEPLSDVEFEQIPQS